MSTHSLNGSVISAHYGEPVTDDMKKYGMYYHEITLMPPSSYKEKNVTLGKNLKDKLLLK